ncbi:hypothetical protein B4Q13_22285, partial [Lacticaseibacillus rhamnosus]
SGALQLDGKDLKVIVADYQMDSTHLVYSTSHLMTHAPFGRQDVAVLASRPGDDGETVLRYPAAATGPQVSIPAGPPLASQGVTSSWDASTGAPGPHDFTVRIGMFVGTKIFALHPTRPPHPAPDVRDDARTSLCMGQGDADHT